MKIRNWFHVFMAPLDDEAGGGGGENEDRGDDFTPTGDDADDADAEGKVKDDVEGKDDEKGEGKEKEDEGEGEDGEGKSKLKAAKKDDAADEDEDGDGKKLKGGIPLNRHEKILARERAQREKLEQELAQYRQGREIAAKNEELERHEAKIGELEKAYAKHMTDGEPEKAVETMQQIRKLERTINEANAVVREAAAEARAVERVRYDMIVERIESSFPVLNPDHEDYDEEIVGEVLELKEAFELKGTPPSKALQKAVKYVVKPATQSQERATDNEPRVSAEELAKQRKAAAVKKAVETSGKQPASTADVGLDSDKRGRTGTAKDVAKMDQDAFAKVPEEELAKLRGDEV